MTFKRYNSIENSYQTKYIEKFINEFSNIPKELFVATEKLDGANIQLYITPEEIKIGKRSTWTNNNFNSIGSVLKNYKGQLEKLTKYSKNTGSNLRLFGEIYGKGIQNRINYGEEKYISFFDVMVNDDYYSYIDFLNFCSDFNLPTVKCYKKGLLEDCLGIDVEDNGEGVVIKPLTTNFISKSGSRFILKKKSKLFNDRVRIGLPKNKKITNPLNEKFRGYINENRVKDIFSKYGKIESQKQIYDYIKYVLEDAKEDFLKDINLEVDYPNLAKNEIRAIFNVGNDILKLLKLFL